MDEPTTQDTSAEQSRENFIHGLDSDQLLSMLILVDRKQDYESFGKIRRELMYRLRCAEPLIDWYKPSRVE